MHMFIELMMEGESAEMWRDMFGNEWNRRMTHDGENSSYHPFFRFPPIHDTLLCHTGVRSTSLVVVIRDTCMT